MDMKETYSARESACIRFLARKLDYFFITFLFSMLISLLGFNIQKIFLLTVILVLFFYALIIEPFLIKYLGNTLGKWLLNIKIVSINNNELNFKRLCKRSWLVFLKGMGLGMPIISLFTLISGYSDLTKRHVTSWDKSCNTQVVHKKIGFIKIILALMLFSIEILLFFSQAKH